MKKKQTPSSGDPLPGYLKNRSQRLRLLEVLLFIAMLFIIWNQLGSFGFWEPWEPLYAEGAYEMKQANDWLVPTYRGEPRFSKPILTYWGIMVSTSLFGENEWAIRLPSTLAAFVGLLIAWLALSSLKGRRCGLLAALILATTPFYYFLARRSVPDTYLLAGITIAASSLVRAHYGQVRKRIWYLLGYFGIGIAVLGKGPLGLVLPALAVFFTILYTVDYGRIKEQGAMGTLAGSFLLVLVALSLATAGFLVLWSGRISSEVSFQPFLNQIHARADSHGVGWLLVGSLFAGAILAAFFSVRLLYAFLKNDENKDLRQGFFYLVKESAFCLGVVLLMAGPWYIAIYAREGKEFIDSFIIHRHLESFASKVRHSGKIEFYIKAILLGFFPWFALLPAAFGTLFSKTSDEGKESGPEIFLAGWGLTSAFLFSLAVTQFYHYISPALPPLALLLAIRLDRWIEGERGRAFVGFLLLGILIFLPVAKDLFILSYTHMLRLISPQHFITPDILRPMRPWTYACLALFGTAFLLALHKRSRAYGLGLFCISAVFFSLVLTNRFFADVGRFKSPKKAAENYLRIVGDGPVYSFSYITAPLVYHTKNRIEFLNEKPANLYKELQKKGSFYCLVPAPMIRHLGEYLSKRGAQLKIIDPESHYRYVIVYVRMLGPAETIQEIPETEKEGEQPKPESAPAPDEP
jgi:4-amino-4-deoxy-L-arabinose transferase-like glycosyltransferase